MILKIALGVVTAVVFVVAGYATVKEHGMRTLSATFETQLGAGDYLAALAAAGKLKESGATGPELDSKISSAARLLVAEDAFVKAKKAAEEKRFADAGALLRGSDALTDSSFKYYEEAQKLYRQVEAFAAGAAHQTAVAISSLENQAAAEKSRRADAEKQSAKLSGVVKAQRDAIAEAAVNLAAAKKEAEAKQMALAQEQMRTEMLKAEVERTSKQKFFNEFKTYRDMAQKGKEQLDNAVAEIGVKRDITALIVNQYISQGKFLFDEAKSKMTDLRNSRTPVAYQSRVDDLGSALAQFLEAVKQLRNAVAFIDEQGSAEFTGSFSKAKTALANAAALLSGVSDFIASNP